jgi:hypothetical protein
MLKDFILARIKEPSTWAGIAAMILVAPIPGAVLLAGSIKVVGTAVAGLLAIWLPEKK